MHPTDNPTGLDESVLVTLRERIVELLERTEGMELANASLRIADVEIDRSTREQYSRALSDELRPQFKERLYAVTVVEYTGRNGRHFADVKIEMKRGLLI